MFYIHKIDIFRFICKFLDPDTSNILWKEIQTYFHFFRIRRRATYHYIKKRRSKEDQNRLQKTRNTTNTKKTEEKKRERGRKHKKKVKKHRLRPKPWKGLSTSHAPKSDILLNMLEDRGGTKRCTIENTSVSMLPDPPCHQNDQGIETLPMGCWHLTFSHTPPLLEHNFIQSRWQMLQLQPIQDLPPYASREDTRDQDVLAVSSCWSQRRHFSGWFRPRRAKRSAVQHLLRGVSQMKSLHLEGAQLFHIRSVGSKVTDPAIKRW